MTGSGEPVRRALEIEDPTNVYVVHAIANRLLPSFARLGIPPNAVSLAGMAFGLLAGVAYHDCRNIGFVALGFVLMIGWHVMDGVDGQLARLTRTQSEFGKVIDGVCDYTTFGAVYLGLALTLSRQDGAWVWPLVLASAVCHAVQSAIYELQRETYLSRVRGSVPAAAPHEPGRSSGSDLSPLRTIADGLLGIYLRVQRVAIGDDAGDARRLAEILARDPERATLVREAYRDAFAPAVRRWSVMSANTRTIAIFAFAAIGRPIFFFWFEIVGLSAILAVLLARQRARHSRFVVSMEQAVATNQMGLPPQTPIKGEAFEIDP